MGPRGVLRNIIMNHGLGGKSIAKSNSVTWERYIKGRLFILLGLAVMLAQGNIVWGKEVSLHLGVLAFRPKLQMQKTWQPFADYLSSRLPGYRIKLHLLDHQEMLAAIQQQGLDFILTNPAHYIFLKEKRGFSGAMATMVRKEGPRTLTSFGGVIFTRSSRNDINTLSEIKGKKIACVDTGAGIWGGFHMQAMELHRAGIRPEPQQIVTTGLPQDRVIDAVLNDEVDVGYVRTGLIEQLERQGRIPAGSIKVLNCQLHSDFPFATSTPLYPEWPFVTLPHVDERLAAKVAATLLQIDPGSLPLNEDMYSFTIPANYQPVEDVLRELRLPPFDTVPQFNIVDVWTHYRPWIVSMVLSICLCSLTFLLLVSSRLRLKALLGEQEEQHSRIRDAKDEADAANRALRLLSASNRILLRSTSEEDQLIEVCRISVEVGGYIAAWVGMAEHDEEKSVTPIAWFGIEKEWFDSICMSWDEGERGATSMGSAIRTGTIQLRQDILNDPDLLPWHRHARKRNLQSALSLPLEVQGEVIGALAIYAPEPHAFQQEEVELLEELAADLAFGIQVIRIREAHEKAQEHVRQLAYYDRLTGLPNRFMFLEVLEQRVSAPDEEVEPFTLLRMDLIHLREINETHGHALGDQIIVRAARQLQETCGQDCLVTRFGGKDFTIICPDADPDKAMKLGEGILTALSSPFFLPGHRLTIRCSIGIVMCPEDGRKTRELLSKVALAASRTKDTGGEVCFYRSEMGEHLARTLTLASRLEDAIQENALELFYQLKIDLKSGLLMGAEALLRWHDPEMGGISPVEFIPVAESRGLMVTLGAWVMRTACRDIRRWRDQGLAIPGRIAVNISARQLESPDFVETIKGILEETGIAANCLELELTESVLMSDPEGVRGILGELKDLGFSIALDDFGTGYSSLAYLKRFPLDTLKIDQTFIRDMWENKNDHAIVATIVAMARQLKLSTVAEGVENEWQCFALKQLGCNHAQGFHYGRPEPAEEFKNRLMFDERANNVF